MTSSRGGAALAIAAALTSGACGSLGGSPVDGGQPVDFTIAGLAFHVSDGAVATSGGKLVFYLSDQPDACLAVTAVPVGTAMLFTLVVSPPSGGTTSATVVPPNPAPPLQPLPAPGEAMGGLVRATGGIVDDSVDAANGSVSWAANADGSVTITTIDVGFAATADRLATYSLWLRPCP
jgi:hypothetical protein